MARRRIRRMSRRTGELVWTALLVDDTISTGTPGGGVIVSGSDWFGPSIVNGRRHATLLGIRGWLTANSATSVTSVTTMTRLTGFIAKFTSDETSVAPNVEDAYTEEDILWTGGGGVTTFGDAAAPTAFCVRNVYEDKIRVKSKRKLTNDDSVSLVLTVDSTTGSQDVKVFGVLRALVKLGV